QVLVNVRVARKPDLATIPEIAARIEKVETDLAGRGRVLVRYSGTEPLLRIMIEGEDRNRIEAMAEDLASLVTQHIGLAGEEG
ncbi:MAG: phosphoglucosamine mutase, partial [Deltaproteobacteria bacterium]